MWTSYVHVREHEVDRKSTTSELQSRETISYAVFCLKKKKEKERKEKEKEREKKKKKNLKLV